MIFLEYLPQQWYQSEVVVFVDKEVVFCPACCTVCNNLTLLFLLSFTICSALFPLSLNHHSSVYSPQWPHGGASHRPCSVSTLHHHSSVLPPLALLLLLFLSSLSFCLSLSLSLSVMAYQDGFYGAADLYVSIPLSSPLSHSSPMFSTLLPVGFSSVKRQRPNPLESRILGCFDSSRQGFISCQSPPHPPKYVPCPTAHKVWSSTYSNSSVIQTNE